MIKASSNAQIRKTEITHSEEYKGFTLAAEWTSAPITLESESGVTYIVPQFMWVGYLAHPAYEVLQYVPPGGGAAKLEFSVKGASFKGISVMFHICIGDDGTVGNVATLGHGRNIICTKNYVFERLRDMADHFAAETRK